MKPNWKDAPKWAQWLAQDANGLWWWYENEPYQTDDNSWWSDGDHKPAERQYTYHEPDWRETLEQRPEVQQ